MYYTYVLYSIKFDRIYIGHTSDIITRLNSHNSGLTKSTKHYAPWVLVYKETFQTRSEAMKREKELKSSRGRDFIRSKTLPEFLKENELVEHVRQSTD